MRDRLIAILRESLLGDTESAFLADHLLANGVIVPPCKVGDTVYSCIGHAYKVVKIVVKNNYEHMVIVAQSGLHGQLIIDDNDFGKLLFLTREEAERALKGESHEHD